MSHRRNPPTVTIQMIPLQQFFSLGRSPTFPLPKRKERLIPAGRQAVLNLCPAAILRCDHSNEILTILLAHGSVCFAAYSKLQFSYILIWRSFEKSRARGGRKEEGVVCIQIMRRRGFVSSRKTAMSWKRRVADIKRKQRVNETI